VKKGRYGCCRNRREPLGGMDISTQGEGGDWGKGDKIPGWAGEERPDRTRKRQVSTHR